VVYFWATTMFVRFRKVSCDGFRPAAAADDAAFITCRYPHGASPCDLGCRMKPRCRWRIGKSERLAPHKLKVYVIENKRLDGKVRQETIAFLGSIDATWLPSFWADISPTVLSNIRAPDWEQRSIRERSAFWNKAGPRLRQLDNRLGPNLKPIRLATHARIPWPMQPERDSLELLDAKAEVEFWRKGYEASVKIIEVREHLLETTKRELSSDREMAMKEANAAAKWRAEVKRLEKDGRP